MRTQLPLLVAMLATLATGCANRAAATPHGAVPASRTHTAVGPAMLVHVSATTDPDRRLAADPVQQSVVRAVERSGYTTRWPGGAPTSAQLGASGSHAVIVSSAIRRVEVSRRGGRAAIRCSISIQVSPWQGTDTHETWEAARTALASGAATAETSDRESAIAQGVEDCVASAAEATTARHVVPFVRRLSGTLAAN